MNLEELELINLLQILSDNFAELREVAELYRYQVLSRQYHDRKTRTYGENIDRITRDSTEWQKLRHRLRKAGVKIE